MHSLSSNFPKAGVFFRKLTRFVLFRFVLFLCFVCYGGRFFSFQFVGFWVCWENDPILLFPRFRARSWCSCKAFPLSENGSPEVKTDNIPDAKIQISRKTSWQRLGFMELEITKEPFSQHWKNTIDQYESMLNSMNLKSLFFNFKNNIP